METLFHMHHVPEEEKLSYATNTLTGPAYAWWAKVQVSQWYYNEPDNTWGSFKFEMLEKFVKKELDQQYQFHMSVAHAGYTHTTITSFKTGRK